MNRLRFEVISRDNERADISFVKDGAQQAVYINACSEKGHPFDAKEGISYTVSVQNARRMTAIYQHKDWWIRPAFCAGKGDLPERIQLLLIETEDDYIVFLAVCSEQCRTDLSVENGTVKAKMSSNCRGQSRISGLSTVIVNGDNPYKCCHEAVGYALELLGKASMKRESRKYPEIFEYFGWCSWDAFYHKVNAQGIYEKVQELAEKKIPARWILIDDGWLDADYENNLLKGFDADRGKFPDGLSGCVQRLKKAFGIDYVGVWHALMGYWNGVQLKSEAAEHLSDCGHVMPDGRIIVDTDAAKAFDFYDKWHSYLHEKCGIDFVKVDGQSVTSIMYSGKGSYGETSAAVQKGLNASAELHFNNYIINCMGMASQEMWNRPSSAISRSSDDFVPEVPHGFCEHALQNGYNNLLQGQFFWGDWDMFWSVHDENRQNSMLRAVSGGPVYISDPVGQTDAAYIRPLIYHDGRIIRCDEIGVPTIDCLFADPHRSMHPLKLFNKKKDCTVIAAFPVNQDVARCTGRICTSDVPGMQGKEYLVYDWNKKQIYMLNDENEIEVRLEGNDAALYVLIPLNNNCRVLGLMDKYVGIDAVISEKIQDNHVSAVIREGGEIGFWSQKRVRKILSNGREVSFEKKGDMYLVREETTETVSLEYYLDEN